jgi:hypothetical protein
MIRQPCSRFSTSMRAVKSSTLMQVCIQLLLCISYWP